MNFKEIEENVVQWHHSKNLIDGSSDAVQAGKLEEEVEELCQDIRDNVIFTNQIDLRDKMGDCLVVLANIAARNGFSLQDALEFSFNKIKARKGKLVDGVFVKEEI